MALPPLILAIALAAVGLHAPDALGAATISARLQPATIPLGQDARLVVRISGAATGPTPRVPPVAGLEIQNLGQTMSMQFVNGSMTTEVTHTFLVRPTRVGEFQIPAITVRIGGDELSTRPTRLRVVEAGRVPRAKRAPPRAATAPSPAADDSTTDDEATRIALVEVTGLPERELFIGEVVPIEIRLYVREGTRVTEATPPTIAGSGFTLTRPSAEEPRQERVRLADGVYTRLTFPAALSPITSGKIPLSATLEVTARVPKRVPRRRRRFDDPFFDSFFDSFAYRAVDQKVPLQSDPITVRVSPLPTRGRPKSFSGGVGRFTLSASAEPTRIAIGDPITLQITVSGKGNFDRLQFPGAADDDAWKTYEPTSEFHPDDKLGLSGHKTFEQALLPLQPDVTEIAPRELSYFDPARRRYVTLSTDAIPIDVLAAPAGRRPGTTGIPAAAGLDGYELAPNKIELGAIRADPTPVATRIWFLPLQALPLLGLAGATWWGRRRRRLALDPFHQRDRKVRAELRTLAERMDTAVAAGDAAGFFEAARRSLQERVAAIEGDVAAPSLTPPEIERRLGDHPEMRDRVREIFAAADALAYGGQAERPDGLAELRTQVARLLGELARRSKA